MGEARRRKLAGDKPEPRQYWIERVKVVYGDRTVGQTPIGRRVAVKLGPFASWQDAHDAMKRSGEGGHVIVGERKGTT